MSEWLEWRVQAPSILVRPWEAENEEEARRMVRDAVEIDGTAEVAA